MKWTAVVRMADKCTVAGLWQHPQRQRPRKRTTLHTARHGDDIAPATERQHRHRQVNAD